MAKPIEAKIEDRIHAFAEDLTELIREAVLDELSASLSKVSLSQAIPELSSGGGRRTKRTAARTSVKTRGKRKTVRSKKKGRSKKKATAKKTGAKKATKKKATGKKVGAKKTKSRLAKRAGRRRSPEALEKLKAKIVAEVKRSPGRNVNAIAKSLGLGTKDLQLPMVQLLKSRKISKKGQKRATTYS